MAAEWQDTVTEAQKATGFTGKVVPRTVDTIGTALRIDRRTEFYTELGALGDADRFEAFLNHWWVQALADTSVSLHSRAVDGPTVAQAEITALVMGAEAS
ncbi:hypothetical protein OIE73_19080 [Streptomyces hirsutus]|uniref:Uncharacterized protein n=1 Tax=Streptomyces hirsutus TaxID=35620 RepID=A0ABZ1GR84_9ACTN|nr:hypothetical protein [Streptomyces hirsutus]WSD07639.1 hypothetical protein OIE73_19080 [Streptomyces hirsutus]